MNNKKIIVLINVKVENLIKNNNIGALKILKQTSQVNEFYLYYRV